jgi:hypothetical protein
MAYTCLVTLAERSYYIVFWAREKIKQEMRDARAEAEARGHAEGHAKGQAEGHAKGQVQRDREWRAWYERMQTAQREGRPFDDPPPDPPENWNGS